MSHELDKIIEMWIEFGIFHLMAAVSSKYDSIVGFEFEFVVHIINQDCLLLMEYFDPWLKAGFASQHNSKDSKLYLIQAKFEIESVRLQDRFDLNFHYPLRLSVGFFAQSIDLHQMASLQNYSSFRTHLEIFGFKFDQIC